MKPNWTNIFILGLGVLLGLCSITYLYLYLLFMGVNIMLSLGMALGADADPEQINLITYGWKKILFKEGEQ